MNSSDESTVPPPELAREEEFPTPPQTPCPSQTAEKPLHAHTRFALTATAVETPQIEPSSASPPQQTLVCKQTQEASRRSESQDPKAQPVGDKPPSVVTRETDRSIAKDYVKEGPESSVVTEQSQPVRPARARKTCTPRKVKNLSTRAGRPGSRSQANPSAQPSQIETPGNGQNPSKGTGPNKNSKKGKKGKVSKKRRESEGKENQQGSELEPARKKGRKGNVTGNVLLQSKQKSGTNASKTKHVSWEDKVLSAAAGKQQIALPPIRLIFEEGHESSDKNQCAGEWALEERQDNAQESTVLPEFKDLTIHDEGMSISRLNVAAKATDSRTTVSIEQHCFARLCNSTMHIHRTDPILPPARNPPQGINDLRAENERLSREVLALRGQVVLAHCEDLNQSERQPVYSERHSRMTHGDLTDISKQAQRVHNAISLTHIASQLSSLGEAAIPKDLPFNFMCDPGKNAYVVCCKDGFDFIRSQMSSEVSSEAIKVVSGVFRNVHLKIIESILALIANEADGRVRPLFGDVISFNVVEVKKMLCSLLLPSGHIDVLWSKTVVLDMLLPMYTSLKKASSVHEENLKAAISEVFKAAATSIAEWEKDQSAEGTRKLTNAFEVSLMLALALGEYVLDLPRDTVLILGRHNPFFANHIIAMESSRERERANTTVK